MRNNQPVAELSIWNNLLELLHRIGYALRWPIQQKNLSAQFRHNPGSNKARTRSGAGDHKHLAIHAWKLLTRGVNEGYLRT